ncbi:elicitor-responsive protein 3-like [Euphorbia lathyris]|uniref:elicitor-responsive protein 3-like n=1 Tax=Euphorbia lathyris TaxID=212925 RepID=UPI0033138124
MPEGILQVLLVAAKGLNTSDFLKKMDPYVTIICRTQEQKSTVASEKGCEAEWNETFLFSISEGATQIILKIMDSDRFTVDDFVGEATIPLATVFIEGSVPPTTYKVVKEEEYCGEIKVALNFTPRGGHGVDIEDEEKYGGWKESSLRLIS